MSVRQSINQLLINQQKSHKATYIAVSHHNITRPP